MLTPGAVVSTVNTPQLKLSANVIVNDEPDWPVVVKPFAFNTS